MESIQQKLNEFMDTLKGDDPLARENIINGLAEMGVFAIPGLIAAMGEKNWHVRWTVVKIFRTMGAVSALGFLVAALADENSDVRVESCRALTVLGEAALPTLVAAFAVDDWRIRAGALHAASRMGEKAVADISNIIPLLTDTHSYVRFMTQDILMGLGKPAIAHLIKTLEENDVDLQNAAKETLIKIGEPAIPALFRILKPKSPANPLIKEILIEMGEPAIPYSIKMLEEGNSIGRKIAQLVITAIGEASVPELLRLIDAGDGKPGLDIKKILLSIGKAPLSEFSQNLHGDSEEERRKIVKKMRNMVIHACAAISPNVRLNESEIANIFEKELLLQLGKLVFPALNQDFGWMKPETRSATVQILMETGRSFIGTMSQSLQDPSVEIREIAKNAIIAVGVPAIAFLVKIFHHQDADIRSTAKEALAAIGKPAIGAISDLLEEEDSNVRSTALETLWAMGERAVDAIPILIQSLRDCDWRIKLVAAETLGNMGNHAEPAIPSLIKVLQDEDWDVVVAAAKALGKMGSKAAPASPILQNLVGHWYSDVRKAAIEAISFIDYSETVVNLLAGCLNDAELHVRCAAIEALGRMGMAAKGAVVPLMRMLNETEDDNEIVQIAAENALTQMGDIAIPLLMQTCKHKNWRIRKTSVSVLGKTGGKVASVPALLQAMSQDADADVAKEARKAMKRLKAVDGNHKE